MQQLASGKEPSISAPPEVARGDEDVWGDFHESTAATALPADLFTAAAPASDTLSPASADTTTAANSVYAPAAANGCAAVAAMAAAPDSSVYNTCMASPAVARPLQDASRDALPLEHGALSVDEAPQTHACALPLPFGASGLLAGLLRPASGVHAPAASIPGNASPQSSLDVT
jgi:hypothetical protein